jgi:hypothetical protein
MENGSRAEAGDEIARRPNVDEIRLGLCHAAQRLAIGRLDHLHVRTSDCLAVG